MFVTKRAASRATERGLTIALGLAIWAGVSVIGSAAGALGDDDTSAANVLKAFQGTWIPAAEGIDSKWTFDGEMLKASVNGTDYTCKVKLDPKAKPHTTIDLVVDEGPDDHKGKTSKGLYKLDGDKLTLCVSLPGKDRPKEFAQAEDEAYLFELKKEKKN
jgi:uncharacterized protein (TIGR03067 family)